MKKYEIKLIVELPADCNVNQVDVALADTIEEQGGMVIDSKEFAILD